MFNYFKTENISLKETIILLLLKKLNFKIIVYALV